MSVAGAAGAALELGREAPGGRDVWRLHQSAGDRRSWRRRHRIAGGTCRRRRQLRSQLCRIEQPRPGRRGRGVLPAGTYLLAAERRAGSIVGAVAEVAGDGASEAVAAGARHGRSGASPAARGLWLQRAAVRTAPGWCGSDKIGVVEDGHSGSHGTLHQPGGQGPRGSPSTRSTLEPTGTDSPGSGSWSWTSQSSPGGGSCG